MLKGPDRDPPHGVEVDAPIPLDVRKQQILKAVVSDYLDTGVPVGSHALAVHLASWSSATIRNELSTLVDVGYLLQPHTSAGRVPSDLGYRYYVDFLMEEETVPAAVRRQLDPHFVDLPPQMDQVLERAALVLARTADCVAIVTGPRSLQARLKHLDLVSLDPGHCLVILVLDGNVIRQVPVVLESPSDQDALSDIARALNALIRGMAADEIVNVAWTGPADSLGGLLLSNIVTAMSGVSARQDTVVVHDGVRNLLHQPEFGDVEQLQQVLDVLEEERLLSDVLTKLDLGQGIQMMIGRETGLEQLNQCSLVLTTYRAGEGRAGTIGVLGPTRMRYSQVAPRVRYVARKVGEAVGRMLGTGDASDRRG